jgi:hypothetical protein
VAVGLANKIVKPKLSKACDMRWHWLQGRVGQEQFCVRHIPGSINDYFVKSLPLSRHKLLPVSVHHRRRRPNDLYGTQRSLHSSPAFSFFFLHHASCMMFFI